MENNHEDQVMYYAIIFKRFYLFYNRGREGERDGEKHEHVAALMWPLLGSWPASVGVRI